MAGMFTDIPDEVRLLDAGAGSGSLTAAFIEEACARVPAPGILRVTTFETDALLQAHLLETMERCGFECRRSRVEFHSAARSEDFIEAAAGAISAGLARPPGMSFNAAILNPPYRKIATNSRERRLLRQVGIEATNLYSAFVSLAIRLLDPGGQVVAIIPRSFCNGPYFRRFRDILINETTLKRIHLFESRRDAFREDGVLQENVILSAVKGPAPAGLDEVVIESGPDASITTTKRSLRSDEVLRKAGTDTFLHFPTEESDDIFTTWIRALPSSLNDLGLSVSTGRVVDFRASEFLRTDPEEGSVPLIYPCHLRTGALVWPEKGGRKPNAIVDCPGSHALLVGSGFYVLTKRFSSKEERRRVVAIVYDPRLIRTEYVGFENHLNYFHRDGHGLDADTSRGIAAFLNSTAVDRYFRRFNGHTQVNATDLRSLRYPSLETLRALGRAVQGIPMRDQGAVDTKVHQFMPLAPAVPPPPAP
jgi:adenine-specific DNA-methyltransferase